MGSSYANIITNFPVYNCTSNNANIWCQNITTFMNCTTVLLNEKEFSGNCITTNKNNNDEINNTIKCNIIVKPEILNCYCHINMNQFVILHIYNTDINKNNFIMLIVIIAICGAILIGIISHYIISNKQSKSFFAT